MKGLCFVFTWTTLLILIKPRHDIAGSCSSDVLFRKDALARHSSEVLQIGGQSQRRLKRLTKIKDGYGAIRIKTVYSLDQYLLIEEQTALRQVIERALRKIASILSVNRVKGPLLLPRAPCPIIIKEGIHKGKCAQIPKGYSGEYCLDNFKIPSAHVEAFAIYNFTHPEPFVIFENGTGLENTDFILYVTSESTELCNPYKTSALAYAAYCRLDSTGRPIAGQMNFCPRTIKMQKFDGELLYKTALHEFFHTLGFSNKLFGKFRKCTDAGVCEPWPQPILKPVDGTMRLVTSAVVREMRKHFNCSTERDFGGPLEVLMGKVTSHWDYSIMHSSIMGPKEQRPYLTLIDPISLAVFEDSGWYKVNYSQADKFIWGKGQGCSFGLPHLCENQEGFCTQNMTGCHHLRLSKARCNVNSNVTLGCGIFAADQRPCFLNPVNSSSTEEEVFSATSRCFLSSLAPTPSAAGEATGQCYERKCDGHRMYLRIGGGKWLLCQPGSYLKIDGYAGQIECPSYEEICSDFVQAEPSLPPPSTMAQPINKTQTNDQKQGQGITTVQHLCGSEACNTAPKGTNSAGQVLQPLSILAVVLMKVSVDLLLIFINLQILSPP